MASFTHLFDTDIISDLINRGRTSRVVEPLREIGAGVCTSLIVVSEVRYGVAKKASASLSERAEAILAILPVCPFEELVDSHYADIRVALEQSGTPIGPNDLFIAAQCRAYGLKLVTANVSQFTRVPGLAIENWLASVAPQLIASAAIFFAEPASNSSEAAPIRRRQSGAPNTRARSTSPTPSISNRFTRA